MTSTRCASEADRLHRDVQRWLHDQGWRELRPVQVAALDHVMAADRDVIVTAPTAGGKTEAAFLPICSVLAADRDAGSVRRGVEVLCVSPLKALINDQFARLEKLAAHAEIPVHRWHGDVSSAAKAKLRRNPSGILVITPESLEATLLRSGTKAAAMFGALRYVVVDELHAFLGTERGAQLRSLLHRVELAGGRRRVPRIGLSATLADPVAACDFLRPGHGDEVRLVDPGGHASIRLKVHGHVHTNPVSDRGAEVGLGADAAIAEQLFRTLRGGKHLVFANSRGAVETYADRLAGLSERERVPNEFVPHHGNLSKELREFAEQRLKDPGTPATAICTSTLEMGIDIGDVETVAQIGPPPGVASLRQRIGRSGRRGSPPTVRLHIAEEALDARSSLETQLRTRLVQTIAMVELMIDRWLEPPNNADPHLSTLVHQVLAMVAQHEGLSPSAVYRALCGSGPFRTVSSTEFGSLLREMGARELLRSRDDGLLLTDKQGERLVDHYTFFTVFPIEEKFRVVVAGTTLGTMSLENPVLPGSLLLFGGRRWEVVEVDADDRVLLVKPAAGGHPPIFGPPGGVAVDDTVRRRMRAIYRSDHVPSFLDESATQLLAEGRASYARLRLDDRALIQDGRDTTVVAWRGDVVMDTLAVLLAAHGARVERDHMLLTVAGTTPDELQSLCAAVTAGPSVDPVVLAASVPVKQSERFDEYLPAELLDRSYATRRLDVPNSWTTLRELAGSATAEPDVTTPFPAPATTPATPYVPGPAVQLGSTPFAVVDLETTGFDPFGRDRIVEIAIVRVSPDGVPMDRWTTLVDPGRSPGPTHVHGVSSTDVAGAPTFAELADTIVARLDGAVVVAHNADYDLRFLAAELRRAGREVPAWPVLCTMRSAYLLGSATGGRLTDLCASEGIAHHDQHTALGDAEATAALLGVYLRRARAAAISNPRDMGVSRPELPAAAPPAPVPGPTLRARSVVPAPGPAPRLARATGDARTDAYREALDAALDTAEPDAGDAAALDRFANDLGLDPTDVERVATQSAAARPDSARRLVLLTKNLP